MALADPVLRMVGRAVMVVVALGKFCYLVVHVVAWTVVDRSGPTARHRAR
jgi:hypothetical protein